METAIYDTRAETVCRAIDAWNKDLSFEDRQSKYCKMASAPLVFYRGANHLFWHDFAGDARLSRFGTTATKTWLQGDLHAYNYGTYHTAKNNVVFGLNDFDEAVLGDYQYDLWRMAISIVLVARQNDELAEHQLISVLDAFFYSYLDTLSRYRKKQQSVGVVSFTPRHAFGKLRHFMQSVAQQYSREGMLGRWTVVKGKKRRFNTTRSKLDAATEEECAMIEKAMAAYRKTLTRATKKAPFEVKDVARRLQAGTGSLGTRRFYVLIEGGKHGAVQDDCILDIKRQGKPTAYHFLGDQAQRDYDDAFKNDARRHALAYRAMTRHTDAYLGWMNLDDGAYSVRERSPFKEAFPGEALDTRTSFSELAEQWAEILATHHTRANKALPAQVHALTDGQEQTFLAVAREIALGYADQVHADWRHFITGADLPPDGCVQMAFTPPFYRDMLPR